MSILTQGFHVWNATRRKACQPTAYFKINNLEMKLLRDMILWTYKTLVQFPGEKKKRNWKHGFISETDFNYQILLFFPIDNCSRPLQMDPQHIFLCGKLKFIFSSAEECQNFCLNSNKWDPKMNQANQGKKIPLQYNDF